MSVDFVLIIAKRFVKAFVAGGVASLLATLSVGASFSSLADVKTWSIALAMAFLTGGLMAVEKAIQGENSTPTI